MNSCKGTQEMNRVWISRSGRFLRYVPGVASVLALSLVWGAWLVIPLARAQSANSSKFHVDPQRLQGTLEKLSEFGRNPEGDVSEAGLG